MKLLKIISYYFNFFSVCMSGDALSLLSPSTMCILGKELRSSGLAASTFLYPLSHPASPIIILSFCGFITFYFYWGHRCVMWKSEDNL